MREIINQALPRPGKLCALSNGSGLWNLHIKLPTSLKKLADTHQQLGSRRTLYTLLMRILRRYFGLHLYRVLLSGVTKVPSMPPLALGYETRVVTTRREVAEWINATEGFTGRLVSEAFANGDIAAVNLYQGELVGYGFTSTAQTRVTEQIVVVIPPGSRYGYAAYTDPLHRNLGLAKARWLARLEARCTPADEQSVAYIATDNFASLAMYYQDGARPIYQGLVGYWRWRGREFPFNSPAARRFGFKFCRAVSEH